MRSDFPYRRRCCPLANTLKAERHLWRPVRSARRADPTRSLESRCLFKSTMSLCGRCWSRFDNLRTCLVVLRGRFGLERPTARTRPVRYGAVGLKRYSGGRGYPRTSKMSCRGSVCAIICRVDTVLGFVNTTGFDHYKEGVGHGVCNHRRGNRFYGRPMAGTRDRRCRRFPHLRKPVEPFGCPS